MMSSENLPGAKPRRAAQAVAHVPEWRAVPRPVPDEQARDPRGFELDQIRRHYKPQERALDHGDIALIFSFHPSDPDFPFALERLHCELLVPGTYADSGVDGPPRLRVRNSDMPRGFATNIERGFDQIVRDRKGITLIQMIRVLDNQLERLLSMEKANTVKIVQFKDTRHLDMTLNCACGGQSDKLLEPANVPEVPRSNPQSEPNPTVPLLPAEAYTREQIAEAKARRRTQTRHLEARMSRQPGYRREPDGVVYTLPFRARGPDAVPDRLGGVNKIHLIIPLLYPLQPLRVKLLDAQDGVLAEKVQDIFLVKAKNLVDMNLTSLVNWLASNLGYLAREAEAEEADTAKQLEAEELARATVKKGSKEEGEAIEGGTTPKEKDECAQDMRTNSRPLEWNFGYLSAEDSQPNVDKSDFSDYSDSLEEDSQDEQGVFAIETSDPDAEKGTSLSFPGMKLHEIGLLQLSSLCVRVKCERCKMVTDISSLKNNLEQTESCQKCKLVLVVKFRQRLMHQNNNCAGYLDLVGCSAVDMMPR